MIDASKLSSDEVNREIALLRQEWFLDFGHHELEVLWGDPYDRYDWNWRRLPADYLEWQHCGPLLEELMCANEVWADLTRCGGKYGVWNVYDLLSPLCDSPTDAIRRAWLAWKIGEEEK